MSVSGSGRNSPSLAAAFSPPPSEAPGLDEERSEFGDLYVFLYYTILLSPGKGDADLL